MKAKKARIDSLELCADMAPDRSLQEMIALVTLWSMNKFWEGIAKFMKD